MQGGLGQEQTARIKSVLSNMKMGSVVLSRVDSEEGEVGVWVWAYYASKATSLIKWSMRWPQRGL
ncbi:MAG: hypothetical protein JKY92_07705 [Magnetovibrio sp.]|nr:hypothetical protein [Magnetovibrio sp.]